MTFLEVIQSAPKVIQDILDSRDDQIVNPIEHAFKSHTFSSVVVIASGTSYNAAATVKKYAEQSLSVKMELFYPNMFLNYANTNLVDKKSLVVFISQGGVLLRKFIIALSPYVLSFYLALFSSVFIFGLNFFLDFITIHLNYYTWGLMVVIALSTSFIATVLLQKGLQVIESTTASILCLLEPISSFIVDIVFQGETLTLLKVVGFGLIMASILMITLEKNTK